MTCGAPPTLGDQLPRPRGSGALAGRLRRPSPRPSRSTTFAALAPHARQIGLRRRSRRSGADAALPQGPCHRRHQGIPAASPASSPSATTFEPPARRPGPSSSPSPDSSSSSSMPCSGPEPLSELEPQHSPPTKRHPPRHREERPLHVLRRSPSGVEVPGPARICQCCRAVVVAATCRERSGFSCRSGSTIRTSSIAASAWSVASNRAGSGHCGSPQRTVRGARGPSGTIASFASRVPPIQAMRAPARPPEGRLAPRRPRRRPRAARAARPRPHRRRPSRHDSTWTHRIDRTGAMPENG